MLSRRGHLTVISGAGVVAEIPRQRPVVRTDYRDPGLLTVPFSGELLDVAHKVERSAPRVSINIDVIGIVVIVIDEVQVDRLIGADAYGNGQHHGHHPHLTAI